MVSERSQAISKMNGLTYEEYVAYLQQEIAAEDNEDASLEQLETSLVYNDEEEVHSWYPPEVSPRNMTEPYWANGTRNRAVSRGFLNSNFQGFISSYPQSHDMSVGFQGQVTFSLSHATIELSLRAVCRECLDLPIKTKTRFQSRKSLAPNI